MNLPRNRKWLAHVSMDGREQTVLEHLTGTAKLCCKFAQTFQSADLGYMIGFLHDIGKYSQPFQHRLLENGPKINHASAGMYECITRRNVFGAFCISGHHGGLPDGGGRADIDKPTLLGRLNSVRANKIPDYTAWLSEINGVPGAEPPGFCGRDALTDAFFTRMLFSCLVDADYLDTEAFMANRSVSHEQEISMDALNDRLNESVCKWYPPHGDLNTIRCNILDECIKKGETSQQGCFSLTVPTGGGKTVASLAFALRHAKANGLQRIIYVIPYTSIIEQTAENFRNILGRDCILEYHSGVQFSEKDEENADGGVEMLFRATENWNVPIVVTTSVCFFESLYASKPSACRKLHNIAGSVVIFDEAQMLPLSYLQPCISAISQLVEHYRVSAVLCTATQPALDKVFAEFLPGYSIQEICPREFTHSTVFQRTRFKNEGVLSWKAIAEVMNTHEQALCIVNSRKNAQTLYDQLEPEGSYHLSTFMVPEHRDKQLREIRCRLKSGLTCRVVSTSMIEAGVDVDFPVVYRELAGLDSILQAAGRCNREGRRPAEKSVVTVFSTENPSPPIFSIQIKATEMTFEKYSDFTSAEAIAYYFNELRSLNGKEAQDAKRILFQLKRHNFPFRTISEQFHLIENSTSIVYVPMGEGADLLERFRNGERSRSLFRKMSRFSVSVYDQHLNALLTAGDVCQLEGSDMYELVNPNLYSEEKGLSLNADFGKALFV